MEKELKDYTLGEVKEICTKAGICENCPLVDEDEDICAIANMDITQPPEDWKL